ncbi:MAG: hypothetical protein Q8Q09_07915 [Deltaproteobacteria bacterium]|nr:hypothetical protein [Deltaproteobacteria bacterium]
MSAESGVERRIHRVYVTRNTEYHVRRGVCVAVKERASGRWLIGHGAVKKKLEGSIRFYGHGGYAPHFGDPGLGDAIYFNDGERDLITSKLEQIDRPEKHIVASYPRS